MSGLPAALGTRFTRDFSFPVSPAPQAGRGGEMRRARPMLGTFVEIFASGPDTSRLASAVDAGFAAVARVDRLMSYHRRLSDVARLNRAACRSAVRVHPWTWTVLKLTAELNRITRGSFDCTVAGRLARWGYLPVMARPSAAHGTIRFGRNRRIRFSGRFGVDLGGIAKGFAVDQAVAALKSAGVTAGAVNAGGDLRVFGPTAQPIFVRLDHGRERVLLGWLKDGAVATSSTRDTRRRLAGRLVSPIVGPSGRGYVGGRTVSVVASSCALADGLTKPALLSRRHSSGALARYRARIAVIGPSCRRAADSHRACEAA